MLPATQPLSRNCAEGAGLLADLKYLRVDQLPLAYTALTKKFAHLRVEPSPIVKHSICTPKIMNLNRISA